MGGEISKFDVDFGDTDTSASSQNNAGAGSSGNDASGGAGAGGGAGDGADKGTDDGTTETTPEELARVEQMFAMLNAQAEEDTKQVAQVMPEATLEAIANRIKEGKTKNIMLMLGAGCSTAAGIPDFRSPGTGLYDNLQKYELPDPTAMFDLHFFKDRPEPFFDLSRELYPGTFLPTLTHCFVKLLEEKGVLVRAYTQNIDNLERIAGVSPNLLVEAHGTFATCHCIECGTAQPEATVKKAIFANKIPRCGMITEATSALEKAKPAAEMGASSAANDIFDTLAVPVEACNGLVKPDIVFFHEKLPDRFFKCVDEDLDKIDLLIVIGTSLKVAPFSTLTDLVNDDCPRLLINRERVGEKAQGDQAVFMKMMGQRNTGFEFGSKSNRDVAFLGDCDGGVRELCKLLDWEKELDGIYAKREHRSLTQQQ